MEHISTVAMITYFPYVHTPYSFNIHAILVSSHFLFRLYSEPSFYVPAFSVNFLGEGCCIVWFDPLVAKIPFYH